MRPLLELFWSFFKIGVFTFGGGYAMIPLIQREVTDRKGWIPAQEFLDLLTVAQSAPGPISLNTSVFVGYKIRGYAGAVAARALADQGKRVLVLERRDHIGGNAYDRPDQAGVLIHQYGPHIFHTNDKQVFDWLSRFTR